MGKFFNKRRFHLSSPANLMHFSKSTSSKNANFSSTSPCSSSSSPCGSSMNGGLFSPQLKKRLTRQRKLRHLTMEDFCAPEEDDASTRSKSLPVSPTSKSKSPHKLQQHWSLSAVPQPLPLPNDELRFPAEANSRGDGRSDRIPTNSNSRGISISSKTSTYHRRKCYPEGINGENDGGGIRLDVPARSAPTTTSTSPTLSPKRFSTVDIFDSAFAFPREFNFSPPSTRRSQLHSPPLQSPYRNPSVLLLNNKSPPETSMARTESNNANVYPLPRPPAPPRHVASRQSDGQSIKGQWQKGKLLGRGSYGSVYEAINRETGSLCAMKEVDIIPDDTKSSECIRQLEQEIRVLRTLEHPNIVQYLGSEIIEDRFCIYLEYVHPGAINKYVKEHCGALTESVVRNFTRHILSGLAYLHSKKTVHRDIKGANLLVDASGVVKLADFGLAKHLSAHSNDLSLKGSPHWMAPEVLQAVLRKDANMEDTCTMDIWSLGCTIIEMVTGKPPWNEFNAGQAMFNMLKRSPPIPESLSSEGKDFLRRCLQRNPEKRLSAALLLEHPFVRNSFDPKFSLCKQAFSRLRLNEISFNPKESHAHHKDIMQHSHSHGRARKHPQESSPATRQSPRSTLEGLPTVSFHDHWGASQIPNGGRGTYSLPTTPSRESS
ncbi:unnamed protein product [Lactuca saligna]|uniref:mitogen-activated protein kinase kinase kinase n=1 Tax=Lactuca saligna TaxID=75948 RepID=A0AA36E505_LACSI|nr:unnamed protein product [Lactuca saligna]